MKRLCRKEERSAKTEHFGFVSCCIFGFSTMPRQVQNICCPALRSNCQVDPPCVGGIWCIMDWCDGLRSGSNTKPSWGPVSAIVAVLHSNFWLQWVLVAYRLDFSIETWNICFSNRRLLWVALVHYFYFLGHTKGGNHWQRRWLIFKRAYQFHMHTVSGVFGGKTLTHPKLLVRGLVKCSVFLCSCLCMQGTKWTQCDSRAWCWECPQWTCVPIVGVMRMFSGEKIVLCDIF